MSVEADYLREGEYYPAFEDKFPEVYAGAEFVDGCEISAVGAGDFHLLELYFAAEREGDVTDTYVRSEQFRELAFGHLADVLLHGGNRERCV